MHIRAEQARDHDAVAELLRAAFESPAEVELVARLRQEADPVISLVCEEPEAVVGHILFTPVTVDTCPGLRLMGLAPMAVMPGRQREGIGSALVRAGLEACREAGVDAVAVLGHPAYYPRFGFQTAEDFHIHSEYDVPAGVFMMQELQPGCLADCSGILRYHPAFQSV